MFSKIVVSPEKIPGFSSRKNSWIFLSFIYNFGLNSGFNEYEGTSFLSFLFVLGVTVLSGGRPVHH